MKFIKLSTENTIEKYPYNLEYLRLDYKNVSFTSNIESDINTLAEYNVFPVYEQINKPQLFNTYDKLVEMDPVYIDGKWYENWKIISTEINLVQIIEQKNIEIINEVQKYLDNAVKSKGYDSILSCCTYATSSITEFRSDGEYCVNIRDYMWKETYDKLSELTYNSNTNWLDLNPPFIVETIINNVSSKYNIKLFNNAGW